MMPEDSKSWTDDEIARYVAGDIQDGWAINLGVGMPTLLAAVLANRDVMLHSENGILGMGGPVAPGEEDPDLVNAGKGMTTSVPGAATMDSLTSFTLIRGGRLDLSIMGAYQVSKSGDLANWRLPNRKVAGIGGAADLAVGAKRVWVLMRYYDKNNQPRVVSECTYPLTARGCVTRVYTDHGVFIRDGRTGLLALASWPENADPKAISEASGCQIHPAEALRGFDA